MRGEAQAQLAFDLETEIAATHWDKVKCRDLRLMYNLMSLDDFAASCPGLQWREFLAGADIAEAKMGEVVAMQPSFFTEVSALITEDRLPAWRAWARWKVISSLSPYLSRISSRRTSASTGPCCRARPSFASAGREGGAGRGLGW